MLKKALFISTLLFGVITYSNLSANSGCEPQCPGDQPVGECYCKYVRYHSKCNYTKRCIEEQVPCTRKCSRQVPEYYSVQKCRYVPQYYTVQQKRCRYVPQYYTVDIQKCRSVPEYYSVEKCRYRTECYDVQEYRTRKKYICEPNYTCVPEYYWKYECNGNGNRY